MRAFELRAAMRLQPLRAQDPCGDAAALHVLPGGGWLAAIVDGLGHGAPAAEAAQAALRTIADAAAQPLAGLMQDLQAALAGTRGAAIGLLRVQQGRGEHAAVGNTRTMRWRDGRLLRLSAQPGIVGDRLPAPLDVETVDLGPGDCVLMTTDGVDERLTLPVMLPEWQRAPVLLCEHLLDRWRDVRDDAGALVLQLEAT